MKQCLIASRHIAIQEPTDPLGSDACLEQAVVIQVGPNLKSNIYAGMTVLFEGGLHWFDFDGQRMYVIGEDQVIAAIRELPEIVERAELVRAE